MNSNFKVVLLAGGKGTRLRPLTVVFPKPLVPLGDKPILDILLTRLCNLGFKEVTISTGYLAEMIRSLCGDGSRYGMSIDYVHEEAPLGTAGALSMIDGSPDNVMVMNGDLLTTLDLNKMKDYHVGNDADVTLAIFRREISIDFGVVETENGEFRGFREKPKLHHDVSMGVNILSRRALEHVKADEYLDMPDLILKIHESGGKVCCFQEDCYWLDIGRMDDYAQAQTDYIENRSLFLGEN